LSTEYVLGKSLKQFILYLDLAEQAAAAAGELRFSLDELYELEDSCELGNGGRARMAAVTLDGLACAGYPAMGYGLRYDYALFKQQIRAGMQSELPTTGSIKAIRGKSSGPNTAARFSIAVFAKSLPEKKQATACAGKIPTP